MTPFLFEIQTFRWSQNHFGAELYNLASQMLSARVKTVAVGNVKLLVVCVISGFWIKPSVPTKKYRTNYSNIIVFNITLLLKTLYQA